MIAPDSFSPPLAALCPHGRLHVCPPRSAYLHVPFCHRRCFYCDFAVVPLGDRADGAHSLSVAAYLELLKEEIRCAPSGPSLSTVYVGGGTPSICTPEQIGGLLQALNCRFGLNDGAEITLEMDPASFDRTRLKGMVAAGITRVSLGGQSFDDRTLERLGRRHRRADLERAADWLDTFNRRGELRSWSLDLIQAAPGETRTGWSDQLTAALKFTPPHLSVYDLSVEPGTVFDRRQQQGQLELPDEDLSADLMLLTSETLRRYGYGRYEVSNYALSGHTSRHNRVYWSGGGWWGFGLGATSAPWGRREARPRTRAAYRAWVQGLVEASASGRRCAASDPVADLPFDDRVLVGLRCREGVPLAEMARACGIEESALSALEKRWQPWIEAGLLQRNGRRWRLSDPEGMALSNGVFRELLSWWEELFGVDAGRAPSHGGSG